MQLELMIELLFALKDKKFTVKIMNGCLAEEFINYYEETESTITPESATEQVEKEMETAETYEQENDIYDKYIYGFKREMNKKFIEVLKSHNIVWVTKFKEYTFKSISDIKKAI